MADVAGRAIKRARKRKASPRETKALVEAGIVESNLTHLTGGDRDSTGFLQQRPSQGWGPVGESVEKDTDQFLNAAQKINRSGFKGSAGQLAQAVQRSAFPGRYDERSGQAEQILNRYGAKGASTGQTTRTETTPGVDRSQDRKALLLNYLTSGQRYQDTGLLALKAGLDQAKDTPAKTKTVKVQANAQTSPSSRGGGLGTFDGKQVASWMVPLLEYARGRGWKGTITSGYRSDADQLRIYKSGVRPAAVPKSLGGSGSKHSQAGFLKGAIDVSDPETLNRILRRKHSRLKFAGAKDPVHFSVPNPDGSY